MNAHAIEEIINKKLNTLPVSMKKEVLDFIDFLSLKAYTKKAKSIKIDFKWEGALKDVYENMNSVELQHKIWEL